MKLGLDRARVIVVGGGRGIGHAIVEILLSERAVVAACARSKRVAASRPLAFSCPVDATDREAFTTWTENAIRALGGLDHLVWCVSAQSRDLRTAFLGEILPFADTVERLVDPLSRGVGPSILALGSQATLLALPRYKSYAAVKAALTSYCGCLARELAPRGIRVNVLAPGEIEFPGGIWDLIKTERPERYTEALRKNPRGSLGRPDEVARLAAFLLSPMASLVSGAHILVDGAGRDFIQF